jgi:hypothetical protein
VLLYEGERHFTRNVEQGIAHAKKMRDRHQNLEGNEKSNRLCCAKVHSFGRDPAQGTGGVAGVGGKAIALRRKRITRHRFLVFITGTRGDLAKKCELKYSSIELGVTLMFWYSVHDVS